MQLFFCTIWSMKRRLSLLQTRQKLSWRNVPTWNGAAACGRRQNYSMITKSSGNLRKMKLKVKMKINVQKMSFTPSYRPSARDRQRDSRELWCNSSEPHARGENSSREQAPSRGRRACRGRRWLWKQKRKSRLTQIKASLNLYTYLPKTVYLRSRWACLA